MFYFIEIFPSRGYCNCFLCSMSSTFNAIMANFRWPPSPIGESSISYSICDFHRAHCDSKLPMPRPKQFECGCVVCACLYALYMLLSPTTLNFPPAGSHLYRQVNDNTNAGKCARPGETGERASSSIAATKAHRQRATATCRA